MNNRFKFRVWDAEIKEYLVGCFLVGGSNMIHNSVDYESFLNKRNFVIEQCTGMKDKNGNLIYEGDVVKIPDDWETYGFMSGEKREVCFRDGGFRLKPKDTKLGRGHWLEQTDALEIVGNIHEQKEEKDER